MIRALLATALVLGAAARGAPLRLAVVYGHNGGSAGRAPLKYAEADAARVAQVLAELGGVGAGDLKLLQGRPVSEFVTALEWAKARAATNPQTSLVVYVSSHADAERGLLPGTEALEWAKLKALIAATKAKARVTIVDGCQSSGLLEASAREAPTFTIAATDELTVKGDAFITSSASDEPSLEAGQFQGSVFTQHLVAGLRGAADRSGDGRVSLEEAYRFAFERTTEGQSGQHPGFATRLSGYGELVMSSPAKAAGLLLPEGVERLSVRDASGRSLVSVRRPEARKLAVPPGTWTVQVEQAAGTREGQVSVSSGAFASVEIDRLGAVSRPVSVMRLSDAPPCFEIRPERTEPRLSSIASRIQASTRACQPGQAPLATVIVQPAPNGQVRVQTPGDSLDLSSGAADGDALVDGAQRWLERRAAEAASTKRKP